jgi:hypothetical protein
VADMTAPRLHTVNSDFDCQWEQKLAAAMAELREFVETPQFQRVLAEMDGLSFADQDRFIRRHLLEPAELARLGITPPEGIVIQRSRFGDARPTVFAVVKYLPEDYRKVTITFDHRAGASWVSRPDLLDREAVR